MVTADVVPLPYSELMRFTLISSPLEAFATSIFFDQLPDFNSIELLLKPMISVRFMRTSLAFFNLFLPSREFLLKDHDVVRVSDDERDILVVWSCFLGQQLRLVF